MHGPYLLRPAQVDISVPSTIGGTYCLGRDRKHKVFIGRADKNLRLAIKGHWQQYEFFWYEPALCKRDAFETHCYEYHRCMSNGGLDDSTHPASPDGVDLRCPVCQN